MDKKCKCGGKAILLIVISKTDQKVLETIYLCLKCLLNKASFQVGREFRDDHKNNIILAIDHYWITEE